MQVSADPRAAPSRGQVWPAGLVWLRRDLRLHDNATLYRALTTCGQVHCAFVFDTDLLAPLPRRDRRVEFIHDSVLELDAALRASGPGRGLIVLQGRAVDEIPALASRLGVGAVFAANDYEAVAGARDGQVRRALEAAGIAFHTFKDQCVFEREEVLTQGGTPYTVFTPYKRAWLGKVDDFYLRSYPVQRHLEHLAPRPAAHARDVPTLGELGFEATNLHDLPFPGGMAAGERLLRAFERRMDRYDTDRDFPGVRGSSLLSAHLRFGTVSVRELARIAHARAQAGSAGAATWLSELVWRDFYFQVLANFPHVSDAAGRSHSFRPEYDRIAWEEGPQAEAHFAAWCEGRTGYPLVDAAMAQINRTGFMHNRLRMVTASFLCKDLGIDWRRGEAYFARHLNDFDLSANNGGWQWAASSGTDAQPWFRIFHPVTQSRKFDPQGAFIRRYLPQLAKLPDESIHAPWEAKPVELAAAGITLGKDYPFPIVDHAEAREKTLRRYAVVKTAAAS